MKIHCPFSMHGTPFDDPAFKGLLRSRDVEISPGIRTADVLVAPRLKLLLPLVAVFPYKKFLVWTNEPRNSSAASHRTKPAPFLPSFEVMNVFTGDIYWHNLHFLGSYHFNTSDSLGMSLDNPVQDQTREGLASRPKKISALFTYRLDRKTRWVVDGIDTDLERKRCVFAAALHKHGLCDVFGGNWPSNIAVSESSGYQNEIGNTPWWRRKLDLLQDYRYNICLENTSAAYYCTEKIWHAILGGTLPIYDSSRTRIYEDFPRGSFIDLADFANPEEFMEFLQRISDQEYLERVNCCRKVFNECLAKRRETIGQEIEIHVENFRARLQSMNAKSEPPSGGGMV